MTDFEPLKNGTRIRLTDVYSKDNPNDFGGLDITGRTGYVQNWDEFGPWYDIVLDEPIIDPDDPDYQIGVENYTALFTPDEIEEIV